MKITQIPRKKVLALLYINVNLIFEKSGIRIKVTTYNLFIYNFYIYLHVKSYLYVACKLFSCNTCGYTYVLYTNLQASIQLCFHDFKANIKVVLTTLMTWQTFQGEMREREKERKSKRLFFLTEQLTASSALKSLINTGPLLLN